MSKSIRPAFKPNRNKDDLRFFEKIARIFGCTDKDLEMNAQYYANYEVHAMSWEFLNALALYRQTKTEKSGYALIEYSEDGKLVTREIFSQSSPNRKPPIKRAVELFNKTGSPIFIYSHTAIIKDRKEKVKKDTTK